MAYVGPQFISQRDEAVVKSVHTAHAEDCVPNVAIRRTAFKISETATNPYLD